MATRERTSDEVVRMCGTKGRYPTREAVIRAVQNIRRDQLRFYKCPECHGFHLSRLSVSLCGTCLEPMTGAKGDWQCATCAGSG